MARRTQCPRRHIRDLSSSTRSPDRQLTLPNLSTRQADLGGLTAACRFHSDASSLSEHKRCIAEELKDFRRHLTAAGRATYQARTGKHDDLVLAVAIALWWAVERRRH